MTGAVALLVSTPNAEPGCQPVVLPAVRLLSTVDRLCGGEVIWTADVDCQGVAALTTMFDAVQLAEFPL